MVRSPTNKAGRLCQPGGNTRRPNIAHTGHLKPDSGLGSQVKVLKSFEGVPSPLGGGNQVQAMYIYLYTNI